MISDSMNGKIEAFQQEVLRFYREAGRTFPWRETLDPYKILVSEIMLQQTQTERVVDKYTLFISEYPDFAGLAAAPLSNILRLWQGLGYNRRARGLKQIAELVVTEYGGALPEDRDILMKFPGIGYATASSICAFAFNKPVVFIETNIRRVFIYTFFPGAGEVNDREIMPLVEASLVRDNPREWYNALMDYGVRIKKEFPDPNRRSAHYGRQSPFNGSDRQIRGKIIKVLTEQSAIEEANLLKVLDFPKERVKYCLENLAEEGFLCAEQGKVKLRD